MLDAALYAQLSFHAITLEKGRDGWNEVERAYAITPWAEEESRKKSGGDAKKKGEGKG